MNTWTCGYVDYKLSRLQIFWDRNSDFADLTKKNKKNLILLRIWRHKDYYIIPSLPVSSNMSAASAMIQYTLKGSQLDNWFIATIILHIILCKMYLKQNVADFVKRIRFVLRTCRELLADLWSRCWQKVNQHGKH